MSRAPGPGPDPELVFAVLNEVGIIHQLSSSALLKVLPDGLQIAHFSVLNHMARLGDGWTPVRLARQGCHDQHAAAAGGARPGAH